MGAGWEGDLWVKGWREKDVDRVGKELSGRKKHDYRYPEVRSCSTCQRTAKRPVKQEKDKCEGAWTVRGSWSEGQRIARIWLLSFRRKEAKGGFWAEGFVVWMMSYRIILGNPLLGGFRTVQKKIRELVRNLVKQLRWEITVTFWRQRWWVTGS